MIVTVTTYNEAWPQAFTEEAKLIKEVMGSVLLKIHHIGSTAVPGLAAKPIIDMMPEVSSLLLLDELSTQMAKIGYEAKGEFGIQGRRYYRKGGLNRTHQIHAFQEGDKHIIRHLAFRDYLRAHKSVADEYGRLKTDIADRCNNDIERYCDEKDPFIQFHEKKALKWYSLKQ